MTSKVVVTARCGESKHVEVTVLGDPTIKLEDGERVEFHVYDDREVIVKEVDKQ